MSPRPSRRVSPPAGAAACRRCRRRRLLDPHHPLPLPPPVLLKLLLGGPKGNCVLLVGPCDAGKTTLFHQLVDGSTHLGTVASMQANEAEGPLASEQVRHVWIWRARCRYCAAGKDLGGVCYDRRCMVRPAHTPSHPPTAHLHSRTRRPPARARAPWWWWTSRGTRGCGARWRVTLRALRASCLWWTAWTSCPARSRWPSEWHPVGTRVCGYPGVAAAPGGRGA